MTGNAGEKYFGLARTAFPLGEKQEGALVYSILQERSPWSTYALLKAVAERRGGFVPVLKTPLKSHLVQRGRGFHRTWRHRAE